MRDASVLLAAKQSPFWAGNLLQNRRLLRDICIASGYREILPRVEAYAEKIGRMLYILPVFRTLIQTDWSRGVARPLFERVKPRHHQITANGIERMLARAGL